MRRWLVSAVAYTLLAVAVTWPLVARLTSVLPHDAVDPGLSTWILWWDAHTRPFTDRWWNAPIFAPMPGAFALSEHMLGISVLTTPLQWLGLPPAASYNVAFLVSFPLTALAVHALVVALTGRHDAAAVGAVAFAFGPYRIAQISHLQMLWTFGVPLALLALHRHAGTRQVRWLVLFAAAWLLQALSNGYLLLFFPVLLVLWIAWHVRDTRQLAAIGVAFLVGSLPLVPILLEYRRWQTALALGRHYDEIQALSADVLSIVSTTPDVRAWRLLSHGNRVEDCFFPGAIVLLLVAAGIVAAARRPMPSRDHAVRRLRQALLAGAVAATAAALSVVAIGPWTLTPAGTFTLVSVTAPEKPFTIALLLAAIYALSGPFVAAAWRRQSAFAFYLIAAAIAFVLALGPLPRLHGRPLLFHSLYWWLLQLPGFSSVRAPARFGILFELCLVVAASLAFARLTASRPPRVRLAIAAVAVAIVVVESWPEILLAPLPPPLSIPVERSGDVALLELPLGVVATDAAAVWRSTQHRLPLVNGYSGYQPVHYLVLQLGLENGDPQVFDPLTRDRDLVVAIRTDDRARWSALVSRHPRTTRLAVDPAWEVYRIGKAPSRPDPLHGQRVAIAGVRATSAGEDAGKLVDGNIDTFWSSPRQAGHEEVEIDLGRDVDLAGVTLELGAVYPGFPRHLEIDCAASDANWRTCWRGSSAALALEGALADARNPTIAVRIDAPAVRRILLRQTGVDTRYPWSIAELSAFAK